MSPTQARPRIRLRLTTWYAASVFLLLVTSIFSMRGWARRTIARQNEEATTRAIELVRSFFRAELSEYRAVEATIVHVSGELVFAGMGLEFLRPNGEPYATAKRPTGAPPLRPPVRTIDAALEPALAPAWKMRLRVSEADLLRAQRRIDNAVFIILPIAVILAAVTGWLVTGRALRPVGEMAEAAERMSSDGGRGRLPVANPDDELGRLGRRFNALLDRLDGTLAQQQRFLADAAHELRTPIARMLADAEVQLGSPVDASADRATLERVHAELGNASSLVDELLQLARADSGRATALLAPGYLDDVVADALIPWEGAARRRDITLVVDALEETPADVDARLITRLLGVLIDNALNYTPAGGTVWVRVHPEGAAAVIEVEDNGRGFAPGEIPHVFERFYRGAVARQIAPNGSGLGLSIAAWIARQHAGAITASSGARGGALLRVSLPLGGHTGSEAARA